MNFIESVTTLESQNCRVQDKEKAYQSILRDFQSEASHQGDENLKLHSQRLLKLLCRDVVLNAEKTVDICLQVSQHCLDSSYFRSSQSADSVQLLQALIHCAQRVTSIEVLRRCLGCLAAQDFASSVVTSQIGPMIDMMELVNAKVKSQSNSVLEETVKLFVRLEEQVPDQLKLFSKRWARLVLPGLATSLSQQTREKSFNLLIKFKDELCEIPELGKHLVKAISSGLAKSLKVMMAKHEMQAMKAWALVVDICGKEFHKGPSINSMLEVIEIGFKSCPDAKCQAFIAWRSLISNFGLDKGVISDPKRIKLLMMVFRYDNAKTEPVAVEKMLTWWHFVVNIDQKLTVNFDKIIYPMLQFCAGTGKVQLSQPSRMVLKASAPNLQTSVLSPQGRNAFELPVFPAVQKLGLEAIALLLAKQSVPDKKLVSSIVWNLDYLPYEVFGGTSAFAKHATFLLNATNQIFKGLKDELNESLIIYTWTSFAGHIRAALEGSTKSEQRDIFSTFLTNLHTMVEEKVFKAKTLFKMAEVCCSFPVKILASTAFNVSGTVRGCPALLLSEVLLTPMLIEACSSDDSYFNLFSFLVDAGASNVQGALGFLQTVSELVDSNSLSFESADLLWKMWNNMAQTLQETIISSNEVNQGDALEYNFGCMCAVLLLPVKQQLASRVSQAMCKAMTKTWKELFHSFARLSALVPTAEANTCLEETCSKILHTWKSEFKEPANLEFLTSLAQKMLDCVDFSAFTAAQGVGALLTLSPSKWARRRQRPMGNLHSFVHFLQTIQESLNTWIFNENSVEKALINPGAVITAVHVLVELFTRLFMHVNTSSLISNCLALLAGPMSRFFTSSGAHASLQRLFVANFYTKLEKLWHEIALCVGGRHSEPYNSELLASMSPLFEVTFLHSRRAIKNQAVALWNTTFSRASTLEYPSALKPVLSKVKEKMAIVLPSWIAPEDVAVIAESPYSEMSMGGDSQVVPPPALPLIHSPKRQRASMLNKDTSPARTRGHPSPPPGAAKVSPAKVLTPKEARKMFSGAAQRHSVVDLMPEENFVVITSPATKKRRQLTEHQKEVLKEKSILPAMYNNLDASQDVSLMSQFATETQNESSMSMAQDVIVINSSNSQDPAGKPTSMEPPMVTEKVQAARSSKRRSERTQSKESLTESEKSESNLAPTLSTTSTPHPKVSTSESSASVVPAKQNGEEGAALIESPFGMFRQTTTSSPPLSLSQESETRRSVRSLQRKAQSEDSTTSCGKVEAAVTPNQRGPRRVPLKQLDSPKDKVSPDKKNVLSSWSAHLAQSMSSHATSKNSEESDKEVTGAPSYMLVEDTQSPDKMKKQESKQGSQSITETPTKSDDSHSPHLRTSSARKLFMDEDPKSKAIDSSATPTSVKHLQSASDAVVVTSAVADSEEAIASSQGFEPLKETGKAKEKVQDHHTMFGFSQLLSEQQETPSPAGETGSSQEPIIVTNDKESDSVVPVTQDSESFLPTMMPTLASPFARVQASLSSSKSSGASPKTQSSSSDTTSSAKSSSSPEADFFPAQSTLQEDSLKTVVNKRKKATPKKYSPEKSKRRVRHHLKEEAKVSNRQREKSINKLEKIPDSDKPVLSKSNSTKAPIEGEENHQIKEEKLKKAAPVGSPELGEVTPDMKSPISATPQRGHSSTKRKRKLTQESDENPKARKYISPEADKEVGEISDHPEQKERKNLEHTRMARGGKRNRTLRSQLNKSSKSKHLLRTRSSKNQHTSPPRKMRRLGDGKVRLQNNDENQNLPHLNEQKADNNDALDNSMDSDYDDDVPLASLRVNKETDHCESVDAAPLEAQQSIPNDEGTNITSSVAGKESSPDAVLKVKSQKSMEDGCDRSFKYKMVEEALSSALAKISEEVDCVKAPFNQNTMATHISVPQEECTPLLLSEDINTVSGSLDHLQAGQSRLSSAEGITEEPLEDSPTRRQAAVEKQEESEEVELCQGASESNKLGAGDVIQSQVNEDNHSPPLQQDSTMPSEDMKPVGDALPSDVPDNDQLELESPDDLRVEAIIEASAFEECEQSEAEQVMKENLDQATVGEKTEPVTACEGEENRCEYPSMEEPTEQEPAVVLHDWSPTKSPSFSILKKKSSGTPSPGRNRVSFAEPVVKGESPIREKYHSESLPTSPLISRSGTQKKGTQFAKSLGKISGYNRRLNQTGKQELKLARIVRDPNTRAMGSPVKSPSQHRATQESQLDAVNPIFPDLVECSRPVDEILPQLTSSLWCRGLHHMMKGRNLNTIGDLSALTEVQVNQLPIRNPKVDTVRAALKCFMSQHGLFKPVIKLSAAELPGSPSSPGATFEQAVTPSSIADEGIKIRRDDDDDLDRLSPIESVEPQTCFSSAPSLECSLEERSSSSSNTTSTIDNHNGDITSGGNPATGGNSCSSKQEGQKDDDILSTLTRLVEDSDIGSSNTGVSGSLKDLSTSELFDVHQKLNRLFGAVVEEMRARQPQGS